MPDPAITPIALARLLQQIYTPTHPESDVPLLLQSDGNSRIESVVPQSRPAKPSNSANAPQANAGDATPTHPFPNCTMPDTDSLVVKARNALDVYICAKALQIDHVMVIAQSRVLMRVSAIFSGANSLTGFADVLAVVFESTKSGQDNLREHITSTCLEKHHQCSNNAAVAAVLDEYEPSLWRTAVPLLRKTEAGRDASVVAKPSASPGLFGSTGSKPSTTGLFGKGASSTFGDGLFKSSNGITSSDGAGAFSFGTSSYTKPAAGLFGNVASAVKAPQNSSQINGNKIVPPTQTQKPIPTAATQKPTSVSTASSAEGVKGSTGSHN